MYFVSSLFFLLVNGLGLAANDGRLIGIDDAHKGIVGAGENTSGRQQDARGARGPRLVNIHTSLDLRVCWIYSWLPLSAVKQKGQSLYLYSN